MTPTVSFSTALELMKIGKRVRRLHWIPGKSLELSVPAACICESTSRNVWWPWQVDMLSDDWEALP